MRPVECLEPFEAGRFLNHFWRHQPCLIRGWLEPEPLSLDSMLVLADEHQLPSRLVTGKQSRADWTLVHGPLAAADIPDSDRDWTVLVQEMDKASVRVADILGPFRAFLPDWMIDDVMISQAADGGSVGAHVDAYDVFLIQAAGHRRWQLATDFNPAADTRFEQALLEDWQPETELTARPGDVLYLPAGIAHHGMAEGKCQTWSVGLRTPSAPELMFYLAESLAMKDEAQPRLDIGHPDPEAPARITPTMVSGARQMMERAMRLSDRDLETVLGRFFTGWRLWQRDCEPPELEPVSQHLASGHSVALDAAARLAVTDSGGRFQLYVNGEAIPCPEPLGRELAAIRRLTPDWLECREALEQLIELGALILDKEQSRDQDTP